MVLDGFGWIKTDCFYTRSYHMLGYVGGNEHPFTSYFMVFTRVPEFMEASYCLRLSNLMCV